MSILAGPLGTVRGGVTLTVPATVTVAVESADLAVGVEPPAIAVAVDPADMVVGVA